MPLMASRWLVVFEKSSHMFMLEEPEEYLTVNDFLRLSNPADPRR